MRALTRPPRRPRSRPAPRERRFGNAARRLLGFATAIALLWVAPGCAGRGQGGGEPLRVGVAPYYPPIVFEQDGEVTGLEADFARGAAARLGRRLEFVRMTRGELLPAVESGRVDVAMSGISVTPERARRVLFTQPYLHVGQLALIRIEDIGQLSRPTSMRRPGVRIGYVAGSTGETYVRETLPKADTRAFANAAEGVQGLRSRQVDVFIHDAPTVWQIDLGAGDRELMGLYTPLTDESLAWAVSKKDPELAARLDEIIDEWRASGQLDRVLNHWIPVRVEIRR